MQQPTSHCHAPASSNDAAQQQRAGGYQLLAQLLRDVPNATVLAQLSPLQDLDAQQDELAQAMQALGQQAQTCDLAAVDDEFHALFIGVGRGEVVPYGSWYQTGFLMEKPLAQLRSHLAALGYERQDKVHEPEDHAAALCEVMALLIQEQQSLTTQADFFFKHMAKWLPSFFVDLNQAPSAHFYQAVAQFGSAFIAFETQYFGLDIQENQI